jgi:hypothetical protein
MLKYPEVLIQGKNDEKHIRELSFHPERYALAYDKFLRSREESFVPYYIMAEGKEITIAPINAMGCDRNVPRKVD